MIGIDGIYDAGVLKNSPSDFYRSFVGQALGTRLAASIIAGGAIAHLREDDLVDLASTERLGLVVAGDDELF